MVSEILELRAKFIGTVQGVNFRFYTKKFADSLDIVGYVKNVSGGNVELVAIGTKQKLEQLVAKISKEFEAGYIKSIDQKYTESKKSYKSFEIIR